MVEVTGLEEEEQEDIEILMLQKLQVEILRLKHLGK